MATPPDGAQAIPFIQFNCTQCQKLMRVPQPALRVFNGPDVSFISFTHVRLDRCPECGRAHLAQCGGVDSEGRILFQWVPIDTPQQPTLYAPTQQNMHAALLAQELSKKKPS